jgi:hypothetical protein
MHPHLRYTSVEILEAQVDTHIPLVMCGDHHDAWELLRTVLSHVPILCILRKLSTQVHLPTDSLTMRWNHLANHV